LKARYTKRLEYILDRQARIVLGLQVISDAVDPIWRQPLRAKRSGQAIPQGTSIIDVFDKAEGQLLILGAPGAGKTTLLLELAQALLHRAQTDPNAQIPVVINLSTWGTKAEVLDLWLPNALNAAVGVVKPFARKLIEGRHLLLLLDGLDEVAESKRAACITAINTYCDKYGPLHIAVCSRAAEYEAINARLELNDAITIAPLSKQQVLAVLERTEPSTAGLQTALEQDIYLRELLTVPLMINVAILAYAGQSVQAVASTSRAQHQQQLFSAYVVQMFAQRGTGAYTPKQTRRWLRWLASNMYQDSVTDFLLEYMPPTWLTNRWLYQALIGLIVGLGIGLSIGLVFGVVWWLVWGMVGALVMGLIGGLIGGLIVASSETVAPRQMLAISWDGVGLLLGVGILFALIGVPVGGLIGALVGRLVWGLVAGLIGGLAAGLIGGLVVGLGGGFEEKPRDFSVQQTNYSNQGIHQSLCNGLVSGLIGMLVGGLISGFSIWLFGGMDMGLRVGTIIGVGIGLLGGLLGGWIAALQHYTLRLVFWRQGKMPLNYVRFLNYAADLLLLERDGGIYRFRHPLLQDYFANLDQGEDNRGSRE
jgi:energy-coupling factor transporter ATP-binding protein EcfA2